VARQRLALKYAVQLTILRVNHVLDLARVNQVLSSVIDPNTERDFVSSRAARNIRIEGPDHALKVSLDVELGYPAASQFALIRELITAALKQAGATEVNVAVTSKIVSHTVQRGLKVMPNVRNIVAVSSGKGGVGKSTVAVNLALAMAAEGARVGVLDADIYGPSQPTMLGITGRPESVDGKTMEPLENYGIQANSIGFLVEPDTPMVWRGPMVTNALQQLLTQTNWKDLDYLVVDMPPGTGDIQLTLAQQVPVTGALIVTTPQDIALLDAMKGLKMFDKVGVPILGIVENMAVHVCTQCGHSEHIFGSGGAQRMAEQYEIEVLGSLPLDIQIREQTDSGRPTVVAEPDGPIAVQYKTIARRVAIKISERAKDLSSKMPSIKVSKS
jgi:ATP-binding protein involved in chromosome partitioning